MWAGQTHQVQADLTSAPHGAPGRRLQKISCPNPPNRDTRSQRGRWHTISQAKRLQGNTRAIPLRDFGELRRMARGNGCLMWSSSSHIARGHWANTQPSAVRPMRLSNALTSTNVLPLAVSSPCRRGRTRQAQADPTRCPHGAPGRRLQKIFKKFFKKFLNFFLKVPLEL